MLELATQISGERIQFCIGEIESLILKIKVGSLTHNPSKISSKCNKGLNVKGKKRRHIKIKEEHYRDLEMGKILSRVSKP